MKKIPPVVWVLAAIVVGYLVYRRYKASASVSGNVDGTGASVTTQDRQPVMVVATVPSNGYLPGMSMWQVQNTPPVSTGS